MGRKEVIEVFTLLVTKNVIHITIYKPLLIKVIERLRDKSQNVWKAAMKLIHEIIQIHITFFDVKDNGF